jgi:hypothetical protein
MAAAGDSQEAGRENRSCRNFESERMESCNLPHRQGTSDAHHHPCLSRHVRHSQRFVINDERDAERVRPRRRDLQEDRGRDGCLERLVCAIRIL